MESRTLAFESYLSVWTGFAYGNCARSMGWLPASGS
jgi:hypothetical protein